MCVCVCVCVYVCMCVCVYVFIYIHIYGFIFRALPYPYTYMHMHGFSFRVLLYVIYKFSHVYIPTICTCAYVYVCIHTYKSLHTYICISNYIYICMCARTTTRIARVTNLFSQPSQLPNCQTYCASAKLYWGRKEEIVDNKLAFWYNLCPVIGFQLHLYHTSYMLHPESRQSQFANPELLREGYIIPPRVRWLPIQPPNCQTTATSVKPVNKVLI